jgi:hypothetical protein
MLILSRVAERDDLKRRSVEQDSEVENLRKRIQELEESGEKDRQEAKAELDQTRGMNEAF